MIHLVKEGTAQAASEGCFLRLGFREQVVQGSPGISALDLLWPLLHSEPTLTLITGKIGLTKAIYWIHP